VTKRGPRLPPVGIGAVVAPVVALIVTAFIHALGFRAEGASLWREVLNGLVFIAVPGCVIGWILAFVVALPIYGVLESRPWPAIVWLIPVGAVLAAVPAVIVQVVFLGGFEVSLVLAFAVGGAIGAAVFVAIVAPQHAER
jgi:hypothetical protein